MSSLPQHLDGKTAQGVVSGESIAQFEIGHMKNFIYLLIDWDTHECAVVDPWVEIGTVIEAIESHQLKPVSILLTHTHHDHVGGVGELIEKYPAAQVILNELDMHRLKEGIRKSGKLKYVKDGDKLKVGSIEIQVLHTPGHSPGECSFFVPAAGSKETHEERPYLFTGDTVFIRDCGRTDFAGGNVLDMFDSIQRVKTLPQRTVILVGHHYQPEVASTIANEMVDSPPFRCKNAEELEALP
jgi:glyoxylase-like metal-dependent hydrolase (beta-lactamase superfamily II)